jgi:hypothetical protein
VVLVERRVFLCRRLSELANITVAKDPILLPSYLNPGRRLGGEFA